MFWLLLLFSQKFKSLSHPTEASPFGHKGHTTFCITWGPPDWAVLSPGSSLLWLLSSLTSSQYPAGKSWLSSPCNGLFSCMLSSYNLCSILFTQRQELNLICHWRHTTKCPLKIPCPLWQHFKWVGVCGQGNIVSNQGHALDLCGDPRNPPAQLSFISVAVMSTVNSHQCPAPQGHIVRISLLSHHKTGFSSLHSISILLLST